MDYTEVAVWVPPLYAESVAWVLQEYGCQGVVISEIAANAPIPDEVAVKIYQAGSGPDLAAWREGLKQGLASLKTSFPDLALRLSEKIVPSEDWEQSWKQHWHTLEIGERLVIKPSWERFEAGPDQLVIELDPKQAFGTGTHPTTQLCLRALEQAIPNYDAPLVFDVGCGSGILSVAAALLGARRVSGCDLDPIAVAATLENAAANGVAGTVDARQGSIETLEGCADLVVANILAEVIIDLAPAIAEHLVPGGTVLASGIIKIKQADVEEALEKVGLPVLRVEFQGEWVLVEARKPDTFTLERSPEPA